MMRLVAGGILIIGMLAGAKTPDEPHRPWGQRAVLDMTLQDAQRCMARRLDQRGNVLVLPTDGGFDIDWNPGGTLFAPSKGEASMTFQIRQDGADVFATGLYRHPFSARRMTAMFRDLEKRCLSVRSYVES